MEYTHEQRSKVGKLNAALGIELVNLQQEGMTSAAKALEEYLARAPFDSRLRFYDLLKSA